MRHRDCWDIRVVDFSPGGFSVRPHYASFEEHTVTLPGGGDQRRERNNELVHGTATL